MREEHDEVPATLGLAIALWAAAVAAGAQAGVFTRLQPQAYAALAAFAATFAIGVVLLDARVRGWLQARGPRVGAAFLAGLSILGVAAGIAFGEEGRVNPAAGPWAMVILFVLPLTAAAAAVTLSAALRPGWIARRGQVPVVGG